MTLKRREFLLLMGAGAGSIALQPLINGMPNGTVRSLQAEAAGAASAELPFKPIKGTLPLLTDGLEPAKQVSEYSAYTVADDMMLPEGYTYSVVAAWGDRIGEADHFGTNNDYISFVETKPGEGFLTVNHEYISAKPWSQSYQQVIGKALPLAEVRAAAQQAEDGKIDVYSMPDSNPLKANIQAVAKAGLYDLGLSVISVRRSADGGWERTHSSADRRISGISGLTDGKYLKATGAAVAIFQKTSGQGYVDGLGDRIIGTSQNCSGGTTPWGTALSGEENFQDQVAEAVYADGTAFSPTETPFQWVTAEGEIEEMNGKGNALGLQGTKYGWVVEVDPANPADYGTKHTALGRFRHEAVGVRVTAGKPLAFYSGCDRRGGHLYKFVSTSAVRDPKDKANSRLLSDGVLYAAKFKSDGTGSWIALKPETPVNPELPSVHLGSTIKLPNPDRSAGGNVKVTEDAAIAAYVQQFKTLGDLYVGSAAEKQGVILVDAHYAASAAGATSTARPEDTDVRPDGTLFITFTSGAPDGNGGADARIFKGPKDTSPYEYGWIMKLNEEGNDPAAMSFKWSMLAVGGEPADGGMGFSNPDNLEIDAKGNIWMVSDMSTDKHNKEVASRTGADGKPVSQSNLRGVFGNNSIWYIPTSGANAGQAFLFGFSPMESEMTGPFLTPDQKTLFMSAQHPGEYHGIRQNMDSAARKYVVKTTEGEAFTQTRQVPIGSNWPSKQANEPPKSSVIAIRRIDGAPLG
jgi:uncharacterized protein